MSRQFAKRVEVERRVLRCLNERFRPIKLNGLSPRAIAAWDQQVDWTRCASQRARIVDGVLRIGKACQAIADQSRGAFDAETFDENAVDEQLGRLAAVIDDALSPAIWR